MITDRFLASPECADLSAESLGDMYRILSGIVDRVEMSSNVFLKIADVVQRDRTILRVPYGECMEDYPGFQLYCCPHPGARNHEAILVEVFLAATAWEELRGMRGRVNHLRVTGVDDMLCGEWAAGLSFLLDIGDMDLCPANRMHCATAIAYEWLEAGGTDVTASFLGVDGFAPLEQLLMALHLRRGGFSGQVFARLAELRDLYERASGRKTPRHKPVLGELIFAVESGIHVDGIGKDPANYEPFHPSLVKALRSIEIGKHSGLRAIMMKLEEYGIVLDRQGSEELLDRVHRKSKGLGRGLERGEFIGLAEAVCAERRAEENPHG